MLGLFFVLLETAAADDLKTFTDISQYVWYGVIGVIVLIVLASAGVIACEVFCSGNPWNTTKPVVDEDSDEETIETQ